jgi:RNA polymerase sigma-70 factor (ECF subfamily)
MEKSLLKKLSDKGFMQGNDTCFDVLLCRYKTKVFTTIYLIVKDRSLAEDLFQEVMIKVVRMIREGKYNEEGKFLPWVVRIARNLAIDYFRKAQRNPMQRETEEFDIFSNLNYAEPSPEDHIISEENVRYIRTLIQALPEKQREVLVMRSYADLSFKEIANLTGVSINTALGRMRYALLNLRRLSQGNGLSQGYEETIHG